ncbi:hypothetical protein [Thermithiobacillus plumbiphilus]|uniref:DUF1641 domain-containing protein n=1 Tax=Thermithiobacillus plumbiphilus TaxID=1729899 RepID=A0ABU9D781_9PROT
MDTNQQTPLTQEQWAGLAWLGDLCSGLAKNSSPEERETMAQALPELMRAGQASLDFVQKHWAGDITELIVAATAYIQRHEVDVALLDLLETLDNLHRNHVFELLRTLGDYYQGVHDNLHIAALIGDLMEQAEQSERVGTLGHRITHLDQIMAAAENALLEEADQAQDRFKGGWSGIYHLLRDPQTQRGLHQMVTLFPLLMKQLHTKEDNENLAAQPDKQE